LTLISKQVIFDYATNYRLKKESIGEAKNFALSASEFEDFKKFVSEKDIDYSTNTEKELEELKKLAEEEKYFDAIKVSYEAMKQSLKHDKQADIEKNKTEITRLLEEEIIKRYYFQKGRMEAAFSRDEDIKAALNILTKENEYQKILQTQAAKK
jgi:carboxyl-terminal processing protease